MKKKKSIQILPLVIAVLMAALALVIVLQRMRADGPAVPAPAEETPMLVETAPPAATPTPDPAESAVKITELMASNETCLLDGDGEFSDWLELCNTGSEAVDLTGWWLSDEEDDPQKWQIPSLILTPGERRVIFCSGKNQAENELHTDFSLSSAGETVVLAAPLGTVLDSVTYENAEKNQSVCADNGVVRKSSLPTPGYENTDEGYEKFISAADSHGRLVISEAVLYNLNYEKQGEEYYDWIELKNASASALELSDFTLSDDGLELDKFPLPQKTLEPGAVCVIFCSGDASLSTDRYIHAPFAISSKGECLYLTDSSGQVSDYLYVHDTPYGGSMGRVSGRSGFFYFTEPTPGKENDRAAFRALAEMPTSSVAQGVYNDCAGLSVELTGEGSVYYTLDGSEPDQNSLRYSGPISVTKNAVIRAVSVKDGRANSPIATFSYILNQNDRLPVVSLVCNPGAFARVYQNGYAENTADAEVSFFEEDGGFTAGCSIKLHGASSRTTWVKKSMKLTFKSRFGGDLEYDLFDDGKITSFHSLLLRGGSDEELETLRDEFASELTLATMPTGTDALTLNVKYCVLYVNGQYYGLYAWREAYSEEYVASHTGSDAAGVSIARAPVGMGEMYEVISMILNRDMSNSENYAAVAERMDMESLAYWAALEAYFNNQDIAGNIRYVKGDVPDSRWRMAFFDLDFALLDKGAGWYTVFSGDYQLGNVLLSLQRSPQFRKTLLECSAALYKNGLDEEKALAVFDGIMATLDEETLRKDCTRWGWGYDYWVAYSAHMRGNLTHERTVNWIRGLGNLLGVGEGELRAYFGDFTA